MSKEGGSHFFDVLGGAGHTFFSDITWVSGAKHRKHDGKAIVYEESLRLLVLGSL